MTAFKSEASGFGLRSRASFDTQIRASCQSLSVSTPGPFSELGKATCLMTRLHRRSCAQFNLPGSPRAASGGPSLKNIPVRLPSASAAASPGHCNHCIIVGMQSSIMDWFHGQGHASAIATAVGTHCISKATTWITSYFLPTAPSRSFTLPHRPLES